MFQSIISTERRRSELTSSNSWLLQKKKKLEISTSAAFSSRFFSLPNATFLLVEHVISNPDRDPKKPKEIDRKRSLISEQNGKILTESRRSNRFQPNNPSKARNFPDLQQPKETVDRFVNPIDQSIHQDNKNCNRENNLTPISQPNSSAGFLPEWLRVEGEESFRRFQLSIIALIRPHRDRNPTVHKSCAELNDESCLCTNREARSFVCIDRPTQCHIRILFECGSKPEFGHLWIRIYGRIPDLISLLFPKWEGYYLGLFCLNINNILNYT